MTDRTRTPLLAPQAVIDDHGGEVPFWLGWVHGDLGADVRDWFRGRAADSADLAHDLGSVERRQGETYSTQAARQTLRAALEASGYLAEAPPLSGPGEGADKMTDVALREEAARDPQPAVRGLVRRALFDLLEGELEVRVPSKVQAREGGALLAHLAGHEAVSHFRGLHGCVQEVRRAAAVARPAALYRVLGVLAPGLFAREAGVYRHGVSYRLYLRARLGEFCRGRGWGPRGPRYHDLDEALAALSRARIGRLVRDAADVQLPEGLELALCEFLG